MSSIAFTPLVEPSSNASPTPPASPFDSGMAYILAQCCGLTYSQLTSNSITTSDFSSIVLTGDYSGYTLSASNLVALTASESIVPPEPTSTTGETLGAGDYVTVQAGFGVQLTLTPAKGSATTIAVIALRGTKTFDEWLDDVEAFPVVFAPTLDPLNLDGQGSAHAGFYALYTIGTDGATVEAHDALSSTVSDRAAGSLAQQIGSFVTGLSSAMPLYVTGHSLGGALASYAALDVAINFTSSYSSLAMYSFASPRVAVGISSIATLDNQTMFVTNFQQSVPNSYQFANAADIVPILPALTTTIGPLTLSCLSVSNNTISFCAQSGDIGNNHSCLLTYIPYVAALASGFDG